MPQTLWVLVEGNDDERFFERVVAPLLHDADCLIRPWKYAQKKPRKVRDLIRSVRSMGADFVYVMDLGNAPCVTAGKERVVAKIGQVIPRHSILVVAREIEGWYLAGLSPATMSALGIRGRIRDTESITKDHFNQLIPKGRSRIQFMLELLDNYDTETARQSNSSFAYFCDKCLVGREAG